MTRVGRSRSCAAVCSRFVEAHEVIHVGRKADLVLGREPQDLGLSRVALKLAWTDSGWDIVASNQNGAVLHAWAQAPMQLREQSSIGLRWPRIGVCLVGQWPAMEHWVLMETEISVPRAPTARQGRVDGTTELPNRPRDITLPQLVAVSTTFADFFAWPPKLAPEPRTMDAVGARLGVTSSAIRERLLAVARRAHDLGYTGPINASDPGYVFHLAANGYFPDLPAPFRIHATVPEGPAQEVFAPLQKEHEAGADEAANDGWAAASG